MSGLWSLWRQSGNMPVAVQNDDVDDPIPMDDPMFSADRKRERPADGPFSFESPCAAKEPRREEQLGAAITIGGVGLYSMVDHFGGSGAPRPEQRAKAA